MNEPGKARSRWLSRRAIIAHVALVIWVPGCAIATRWQVGIAVGGNSLGWVYSVMWPTFALFAVVFWWYLIHDDPDSLGSRGLKRMVQDGPPIPEVDGGSAYIAQAEAEDPELAAYNAYLESLSKTAPSSWQRR
jgi:hypothetical protein